MNIKNDKNSTTTRQNFYFFAIMRILLEMRVF